MANFFNGNPQTDSEGLMAYVKTHSPTEMLSDVRSSSVDPNDLPGIGDMVKMFLKADGRVHAKVLYAEGIRQLEAAPHRLAPDVNLLFARRNLCACCLPDEPLEAFAVIRQANELVTADPALCLTVAMGLYNEGHLKEASAALLALDQIPIQSLLPKLQAANMSVDLVNQLKGAIRKRLGGRKMRDLNWLSNSGTGELPDGLLDMDLMELAKHGVSAEILNTIKTAVLFQSSNDRKMWFCGFFDVSDPRPLLQRNMTGRFRADFYNRIGRSGEDGSVNVYGVHHN